MAGPPFVGSLLLHQRPRCLRATAKDLQRQWRVAHAWLTCMSLSSRPRRSCRLSGTGASPVSGPVAQKASSRGTLWKGMLTLLVSHAATHPCTRAAAAAESASDRPSAAPSSMWTTSRSKAICDRQYARFGKVSSNRGLHAHTCRLAEGGCLRKHASTRQGCRPKEREYACVPCHAASHVCRGYGAPAVGAAVP